MTSVFYRKNGGSYRKYGTLITRISGDQGIFTPSAHTCISPGMAQGWLRNKNQMDCDQNTK
jgi:hypothetical protein